MKIFALPDLGEGLQEAEIVAWRVAVGDRVVADQPLAAVETDKAVVEIPSPRAGRVAKLYGNAGDVIRVGTPLVEFEDDDRAADTGTIVGEVARAAAAAAAAETGGRRVVTPRSPAAAPSGLRAKAAPAVRDLARRLGVALERIAGSGPAGAVTSADVEHAAAASGGYEPLRGARRAMAANMARAQAEVARTTVVDEADIDRWSPGEDVTIRLVRGLALACRAEPALNAWYDARANGRTLHARVDLGLAVDTREGLFVPVICDVGALDVAELRESIDRGCVAAEQRTLASKDLHGATITLSNFGMLAGRFAVLMIVPPQVAIAGAGRIAQRVVAGESGPVVRRMLPLSITFDHRAVTGGEAARFLAAMIEDLQKPG